MSKAAIASQRATSGHKKSACYSMQMKFTSLSNEQLLSSLRTLVGQGNRIMASVLAYLIEVEDRRLHLELAYSTMSEFCQRELGFSEDEAYRRVATAHVAKRFPVLLGAIGDGRIRLSSVLVLRDVLTADNVEALITEATGKTKFQVQEIVRRIAPKPDVPASVRKIPEQAVLTPVPNLLETSRSGGTLEGASSANASSRNGSPPPSRPAPLVSPLGPARYLVQFSADQELFEDLERLRGLTSNSGPIEEVLPRLMKELVKDAIAKVEKKYGKTERPQRTPRPAKPERITHAARREVVARDRLQCAFVSRDGVRCQARNHLELDHVKAKALGGTGEAENARLLCRPHNRHAAELAFGREHVEKRIRARQSEAALDRARVDAKVASTLECAILRAAPTPKRQPRRQRPTYARSLLP